MSEQQELKSIGKTRDYYRLLDALSIKAAWLGADSRLRLNSWNSNSSVTRITVRYRIMLDNGDVTEGQFDHVPNTDRSIATTTQNLGIGRLLAASVFVQGTLPKRGQTFIRLEIFDSADNILSQSLCSDYLDGSNAVAFPDGPQKSSVEGPGVLRMVTGTDPAAGAEVTESVPTNARWKIKSIRFVLVTDATVATRQVQLLQDDGTAETLRFETGDTQTASLTRTYHCTHLGTLVATVLQQIYFNVYPEWILMAAMRILTATSSFQGGDNFGAPILTVEEWIEE